MVQTIFSGKRLFIILFIAFLFIFPSEYIHAAGNEIMMLEPKHPAPGETVQVTLKAHSIDFETALVTWKINGNVIEQDYSLSSISFEAGPVGTHYTISVSAEDASGEQAHLERSFSVSDLSFVWEGRSYTPAFYKGKSLLSIGGELAIQATAAVADSRGNLYNPDELFYSWFINDSYSETVSGKGKHSVVVSNNDRPRAPLNVYLKVKDSFGNVRAEESLQVPVTYSKTVLYENNPHVGIRYDRALEDVLGVYGREVSVVAEPYFISADTRRDTVLEYEWIVAGDSYSSLGSLPFGPEGDSSGSTHLEVTVKNKKYWLQNSRADLTIEYGERNTWSVESANTNPL